MRLVRDAKRRGLPVTCEVTPHHLTLTDEACADYDTHAKCNPPLRTQADIGALREGLADGTIDAIATDHAPHSPVEKELEFENAAFGMIGLETALPLVLDLVRAGRADAGGAGRAADRPRRRRCSGLPGGTLARRLAGRRHRDSIPRSAGHCEPARLRSQIAATRPFAGRTLRGQGRANPGRRTHRLPGGDLRS